MNFLCSSPFFVFQRKAYSKHIKNRRLYSVLYFFFATHVLLSHYTPNRKKDTFFEFSFSEICNIKIKQYFCSRKCGCGVIGSRARLRI